MFQNLNLHYMEELNACCNYSGQKVFFKAEQQEYAPSINGQPMLYWTIKYALEMVQKEAVFVSSDSLKICEFAKGLGVGSIHRPSYLTGDVPILDVYRHAVVYLEASKIYDQISVVIGLQPDHPDRRISLNKAYEIFSERNLDRLSSKNAAGEKWGTLYPLQTFY